MELTDLIVKLNRESAKNTPDVYKKVMAKARAEGLVKSQKKTSSQKSQTQRDEYDYDYDYDYGYGYRGGSSSRGGSGIARRIISWIVALILLALSVTLVTYTVKIVIPQDGTGTNTAQPSDLINPLTPEDSSEPEGYVLNVDES